MKKHTLIIAVLTGLMMLGCVSRIVINREYKSKSMSGKQLHIEMVGPTKIDYDGNMDNEFSQEGRYGKIRTFICSTAVVTIGASSTFCSVDAKPVNCNSYCSRKLEYYADSNEFIVKVPNDSCISMSDSQGIFLFVEQTTVTSYPAVKFIVVNLIPVGAIPHKPLTIDGKFVYWDAAAKKPIAWGYAYGTYDNGPGVTREHWLSAACDFSLNMVKGSPFDTAYVRKKANRK